MKRSGSRHVPSSLHARGSRDLPQAAANWCRRDDILATPNQLSFQYTKLEDTKTCCQAPQPSSPRPQHGIEASVNSRLSHARLFLRKSPCVCPSKPISPKLHALLKNVVKSAQTHLQKTPNPRYAADEVYSTRADGRHASAPNPKLAQLRGANFEVNVFIFVAVVCFQVHLQTAWRGEGVVDFFVHAVR